MVHDVLNDPFLGSGKVEFLFHDEGMKGHVLNPAFYFIDGHITPFGTKESRKILKNVASR